MDPSRSHMHGMDELLHDDPDRHKRARMDG